MNRNLLPLVATIVSSHASGNSVTSQKLTEAIRSVYATLNGLTNGTAVPPTGSSDPLRVRQGLSLWCQSRNPSFLTTSFAWRTESS